MKKCLIIANGKPPAKSVVKHLIKMGYSTIICADGGANSAKKIGVVPNFIVGDLDSISESTLKYFRGKSKIVKYKRQNDTDVEKSLKFAISKKNDEVILLGVTGDRLDHTICNLGIILKFFDKIKISLVSEKSFLIPINTTTNFKSKIGETISLYAFDNKTKISSIGLKYKLDNTALPFGVKESTSNAAIQNNIKIKVTGGIVFVIRDYNFMKKYDLF